MVPLATIFRVILYKSVNYPHNPKSVHQNGPLGVAPPCRTIVLSASGRLLITILIDTL